MTKRVIGILLVFLMVVSNISVTFAADASQNYNDDTTKGNSSVSESKPVTVKINKSLEIAGNDNGRIKPIEEINSNEKKVDEKSSESSIKFKVASQKEVNIDKNFSEASKLIPTYDNNSEASTNTVAASLCDIIVYDLKRAAGQPSPFIALNDSDIEVTIANIGTASTGNFTTGIKIDNILMGSFTVSSLASYTGVIYTITLQQVPEGNHTIQIVGDYNNAITESDETNNAASATFQWVGTPNLKAEFLRADGTPPFEVGNGVDFTFRVSNNGNGKVNGNCSIDRKEI